MSASKAELALPGAQPGDWSLIGRAKLHSAANSAVIEGGFAVSRQKWGDMEFTFRTRAPVDTKEVQLWAGFSYRDRDSCYVVALRGGNDNDLYLARYAPDGGQKFFGFAPLGFHPVPGTWEKLRIEVMTNRFHVYLNDETLPRINIADDDALWTGGSVILGGGWLPSEFADCSVTPLTSEQKSALSALGDQCWAAPAPDKEAIRKAERAKYAPAHVTAFGPLRTEISLDGNWLFQPDYELAADEKPIASAYEDNSWHVMAVPQFWTPGLSWLHGETGFADLKGVAATKGEADSLYVEEFQRADAYTFDWRKTKGAWYRHYVDLPADLKDRRFELNFDAIAKISEVWVNGVEMGSHVGMFGQMKCDVTRALKPGRNVIAVHVISEAPTPKKVDQTVEGVAVTVEVTSEMLRSLAHGMFQGFVGGIWQPVKLTVLPPVQVSDCFVQPKLDSAKIELELSNRTQQPANVEVDYTIIPANGGPALYQSPRGLPVKLAAGATNQLEITTPTLTPKLWSPQEPNLYKLDVRLKQNGEWVDQYFVRFGFRTFATDGGKLLLNGRPYWLRGGDPFPNTLRPNDGKLARKFMELARAGNVRVTRSHIVPFTSTWLDAADEVGMAVSYEGTWPWLMLHGEPPDATLLAAWKDEFLSLIRQQRNHPSIILWTVNNEMKFPNLDVNNPELLTRKWRILDDAIRAMRRQDPTRPIVASSGYARKEARKSYDTVVLTHHFDDGDMDDAHRYFGWYNETFFHLYDGQYGRDLSTPGRPLISQEMSTGYPNNDDGHPVRFYLFKNYTPQAFVGDDAYENADPAIFLQRQCFLTKELAETFRRVDHNDAAGVLHFAYFSWFETPWSAEKMEPLPAYYGLKAALQPVLVSAELFGRHFYAGSTMHRRVCVVNDAENGAALPPSKLTWEFQDHGRPLGFGRINLPSIPYYTNLWQDINFAVPRNLPAPRVDGQLVLKLEVAGKLVSENSYDVVLATRAWAAETGGQTPSVMWPEDHRPSNSSLADVPFKKIASLDEAQTNAVLIADDAEGWDAQSANGKKLLDFISQGGRVLLLNPAAALPKLFPEQVKDYVAKAREIVTMHVPESPVFDGLEPLDLAWFENRGRQIPFACGGVYQLTAPERSDAIALAQQCDIHGYLQKTNGVAEISGTPLLEIRVGKGVVIASEMSFDSGTSDPIARRLLSNVIRYLGSESK